MIEHLVTFEEPLDVCGEPDDPAAVLVQPVQDPDQQVAALGALQVGLPAGRQRLEHVMHALRFLDLFAVDVDLLVDDAQALVRNAQAHETLLGLEPEALVLQVRQEAAARLIVGVGDVISGLRTFPGHLAHSGHD